MTIADKMRQMTDEQLARVLEMIDNSLVICDASDILSGGCVYNETHPTCEGCSGYIKWLQKEVLEI